MRFKIWVIVGKEAKWKKIQILQIAIFLQTTVSTSEIFAYISNNEKY